MKNSDTTGRIAEVIKDAGKGAGSFLVVSHYNPDADAYGSSGAMTLALKEAGKRAVCVNESGLHERYEFIPGSKEVKNLIPDEQFDIVIVCDCGALSRTGDSFREKILSVPVMINIDHHSSNDYFGHYNLVNIKSSSTSEMVYDLLKEGGFKITPDIASAIFTGISGDTGSFRYSNTSAATFKAVSELLSLGADLPALSASLYGNSPLSAVQLQSEALCNMKIHAGGKIAELVVDPGMYRKYSAVSEDTEALVERARDIKGVLVSVLIKEDTGIWRVSLRSVDQRYDVSALAAEFGGGGHKAAAAFRWRNSLEDLRAALLPKLEKLVT